MTRRDALKRIDYLVKKYAVSASELKRYVIKLEIKDLIIEHAITREEFGVTK